MERTLAEADAQLVEGITRNREFPYPLQIENMRTVKVELTAAEVKALAATPKTLVAAPGAGKMLQFVGGQLRLVAGSEVLAEDGGGSNLGIKLEDDTGIQVSDAIEATGFIDQAADTITSMVPVVDAIKVQTGVENQPMVLHNIGAGEITGNASDDAELHVFLAYRVIDL